MEAATYSSHIRDDGSINFPIKMRHELGLRTGDKITIVVYPSNENGRSRKSSTQMMPAKQKRMDELLFRHREGDLSSEEKNELEALVLEAQILTVEKAKRSLRRSRKSQRYDRREFF
jgi:bifunctional DNA-binding transcriptional regulator/antitoxin component of YhaV-PrlF toxin-antitoxin module